MNVNQINNPESGSCRLFSRYANELSALAMDTLPGYGSSMKSGTKSSVSAGLKRVEGQVRGIQRMLEEDRYCIDILTQIQAVRAALHRLEETILKDHVTGCVRQAFASGDADTQAAKVDELVAAIGRMTR